MDDGMWLDATAQAELVRSREVKPEELIEASRARLSSAIVLTAQVPFRRVGR